MYVYIYIYIIYNFVFIHNVFGSLCIFPCDYSSAVPLTLQCSHEHACMHRVLKVAKGFVGEMNFAVSNKESYRNELESLGLDASADVVVGIYDSKGKYAMTDKFR